MAKRIIIFSVVAIIVAAFLGGLSYFQFVLKPQMIRQFLSQMTPPPATVHSTSNLSWFSVRSSGCVTCTRNASDGK